jgi:hypothetical protein
MILSRPSRVEKLELAISGPSQNSIHTMPNVKIRREPNPHHSAVHHSAEIPSYSPGRMAEEFLSADDADFRRSEFPN